MDFLRNTHNLKTSSSYSGRLLSKCPEYEEDCANFCVISESPNFNRPNQQIKLQPTSWQYPLINHLVIEDLKDKPENADQVDVIELESLEMLPSENFDLENKDWKIFHSTIDPNAGTMAVLMDASLRYRQFDEFSSR